MSVIEQHRFGTTHDGRAVDQFVLTNANGASARLINLGAGVTHLFVPDRHGKMADVVLGFDTLDPYQENRAVFGAVVGRFGNRIARGSFWLDGVRYALPLNNGPNHLHGGPGGLHTRIWKGKIDGKSVRFSILDPDGAEGYPGNVRIEVVYHLTDQNGLKIEYSATTDKATPINLTNHAYFNLHDGGRT